MTNALRLVAALLPALAVAPAVRAEPPKLPVPAFDQSAVAKRGYFYVGGKYVGDAGKDIMQGQIFVEVLAPKEVRRPYPLVLIHGAAQTATNWMGTPDGRKGWAEYFVEQGYVVYMIDQPMRGRSARRSDGRGPDTAPGYRVERTHRRAPSGAREQKCTVHCAASSHHHRSPEAELPFA